MSIFNCMLVLNIIYCCFKFLLSLQRFESPEPDLNYSTPQIIEKFCKVKVDRSGIVSLVNNTSP